jgi:cytochrome b pre-mRNA-processing protein 3
MDLYGAVVAQARWPGFFARQSASGTSEQSASGTSGQTASGTPGYGVLDTPEGRMDMIILLIFPLIERLQAAGPAGRRMARLLSETFITDIDDCLREMGVGDLTVPKKVKRAAQALGERCLAYRRAAGSPAPVDALADELGTSVPGLDSNRAGAEALARYVLGVLVLVAAMPADGLLAGRVDFPDPARDHELGVSK